MSQSKEESADVKKLWQKLPWLFDVNLCLFSYMFSKFWFLHQNVIKINYTYLTITRKAKQKFKSTE